MSYVYWLVLLTTILFASAAERYPRTRSLPTGETAIRPDPVFAFILSAVLMLTAALRYRTGTDYMAYYRWSATEWSSVWQSLIHFQEAGFQVLVNLSRSVSGDPQAVVFFSAVITVGIYCLTLYRFSPLYLLGMLLFLFLGDWQGSFNGVRQYLAAAILFSGHRLILERKFLKYLFVVLIASLFHVTALVMIVPYFLLSRKADITQLILMMVGALIIRFSYAFIFETIGAVRGILISAIGEYATREVNPLRVLVAFIPVVLYYLTARKTEMTNVQTFYMNALIFHAFAMLAGTGSAYLARIGIYTGAIVPIGYGHLLRLIPEERTRKLSGVIACFVLLLYWIYSVRAGGIANFHWVFER